MASITRILILGCVLVLAFAPLTTSSAATVAGPARAIDANTLQIGSSLVRLYGIDGPDLQQTCFRDTGPWPCGRSALDALSSMIRGQALDCAVVRIIGGTTEVICYVGLRQLNAMMVGSGWALDWPATEQGAYAFEQSAAQRAGLGLWASSFDIPLEWRRRNRRGIAR